MGNCSSAGDISESLIPQTEIRLEFRGSIQKLPTAIQGKTLRVRARAYSCPDWDENYSPRVERTIFPECMDIYVEKTLEVKNLQYKLDMDVPANWTHAFIELLDIESVKGMFSPGYNPNWFGMASGEIVTFQHDFVFRSQENPIPDKKQRELAEKFSPLIVLDRNKLEIPTNLEKYHGQYRTGTYPSQLNSQGKAFTEYEGATSQYMILPERSEIANYEINSDPTHIYVHVRYASSFVSGTQAESLPGFRDDQNYWYDESDKRYVISYWFWYDYNLGPSPLGNVHQGDLESFSVLTDSKGNPLRLMVTGHDHILLDTDWKNINSLNHHPILFIASGRKSDGGNPTSPYGNYEVHLEAGNALFNSLADPRDVFPDPQGDIKVIFPPGLRLEDGKSVLIGPNKNDGIYVDLASKAFRRIEQIVLWEEPGWINQPSFEDPDGHHRVDPKIAEFLKFPGRIGKHPKKKIDYFRIKQWGQSPRNVPFKTNIEQHYTYERPRTDRSYTGRIGNYGPKFEGDSFTPQFTSPRVISGSR
jgi:hypothetical protein